MRSHVHDWANVGAVVHSHAIFADVGPTLANDLLVQRIMKVIFFHRNKSGPYLLAIVINDVLIPSRHTTLVNVVCMLDSIGISFFFFSFFFSFLYSLVINAY